VFPEPVFSNGPDHFFPNRTALNQACRRVLIADDDRRVRRIERTLEPGRGIFPVVLGPEGAADNAGALPSDPQMGMHEDHIRCFIRVVPIPDVFTVGEMGTFKGLPIMPPATQVTVDRQALAA